MVRGNWQRRVELNVSRRQEAKQKKHSQDAKKIFKAQAQEFMALLNCPGVNDWFYKKGNKNKVIHIWTDSIPSDAPPILDMLEYGDDSAGGGGPKSMNGPRRSSGKQRGGRNRSTSIENEAAAKKKAHPRSKKGGYNEPEEEDLAQIPRLCRSHFFTGKCSSCSRGGKKGSEDKGGGKKSNSSLLVGRKCPYIHFPEKVMTLNDALIHSEKRAELTAASELALVMAASFTATNSTPAASVEAFIEIDDGGMDMLYYLSLNSSDFPREDTQPGQQPATLSDTLAEATSKHGCGIASLVYFMIDDHLLYDRYRKGLLVQEQDLLGDDSRRPVSGNERALLQLPASILEHVLLYLEDKAVASMCAVCKSWHQEIGKHSGNLWKHLLQRRKWPIPSSNFYDSPTSDPAVERVVLQRAFISHYTAVRDLTGIQQGISAVLYRKKINEREGCFRSFDSSRRSPQQGNPSVSLKIWSPNRFLAAYQQDCTLRLFDSVERSGGGGGHRLCRELVSRSMDPYQSTKKRGCILLDMGLDEESIGALLHVREDGSNAEAFILTVILREDFLIDDQDAEYEATTQVIDIGQSVLNYLLSCEDVGHGLLQLHDFIRDGGDLDDVEVLVSPTLEACGYGRFMTEVSVSIPNIEIDTDDDSGQVMNLLFRRFCLFSSSMGAIVWMADNTMLSRNEQFALSSCRIEEGGRYGCRIAAAACDSPYVVVLCIDPSGDWQQPTPIMELPFDLQDIIEDGWLSRQSLDRPVVVFDDDIVVAQNTIVDYGEGKKKYLSRLLVLPFTAGTRESAAHTILLDGDVVVQHLVNLRSTHILALCKVFTKTSRETNGGQGNLNDIAGHWFGGGPDGTAWSTGVVSYGILIDFPSRQEIQRICLVENYDTIVDISEEDVLPLLVAASEETVAASVWWSGVVMTGESVRKSTQQEGNQRDHATESSKLVSAKKKKKKTLKKVGKKDGFARGMSLRG